MVPALMEKKSRFSFNRWRNRQRNKQQSPHRPELVTDTATLKVTESATVIPRAVDDPLAVSELTPDHSASVQFQDAQDQKPTEGKEHNTDSICRISLWDKAYDALRLDQADLIERYEALAKKQLILSKPFTDFDRIEFVRTCHIGHGSEGETQAVSGIPSTNSFDPVRRQETLDRLLQDGQETHDGKGRICIAGHMISIKSQLANMGQILTFSKDWIGDAVKASPEASIAWSIVCLGLPLLTKPIEADDANRKGLTYITSRMRFYIAVENLLFPHKDGLTSVQKELQSQVIELYKEALDYQIRTVIRFYHRRWFEEIHPTNDWKKMLDNIVSLEKLIRNDFLMVVQKMNNQDFEVRWQTLEALMRNAAKSHSSLLDVSRQQFGILQESREIAAEQLKTERTTMEATQRIDHREAKRQQEKLIGNELKCFRALRQDLFFEESISAVSRHVEGTCVWFLSHRKYTKWLNSNSGSLLVSADPGCGKSVLARYLVEEILPHSNPDAIICYFFFKDQVQGSLRTSLCALLYQLLDKNRRLLKHALERFKKDGAKFAENVDILLEILDRAICDPDAGSIIFVLDALDECDEADRSKLFGWLESTQRINLLARVKFLLTSRPYPEVLYEYDAEAEQSRIHLSGNERAEALSQEIDLVIRHRAQELHNKGRLGRGSLAEDIKHEIVKTLCGEPNNTYLWVYLVFEDLERQLKRSRLTLKEVKKLLTTLPPRVEQFYERMLNRCTDEDDVQSLNQVFSIMLAAVRPLTLPELQCAMRLKISPPSRSHDDLDLQDVEDFAERLRGLCGLFIQVYEQKINFLHQTAREFLTTVEVKPVTENDKIWHGSISIESAHTTSARLCITYLSMVEFATPIQLETPDLAESDNRFEAHLDDSEGDQALDYPSDQFWISATNNDDTDFAISDSPLQTLSRVTSRKRTPRTQISASTAPKEIAMFTQFPLLRYAISYWNYHFNNGSYERKERLLIAPILLNDSALDEE